MIRHLSRRPLLHRSASATDQRVLAAIAGVLLVLTLGHDLDHVRQGRTLDWSLYAIGALAVMSTVFVLALLVRNHPLAASAAVMLGVVTLVGVAAVHVAPERAWFSDSYSAAHVDGLSWTIVVGMMLTGLVLAVVGLLRNEPSSP